MLSLVSSDSLDPQRGLCVEPQFLAPFLNASVGATTMHTVYDIIRHLHFVIVLVEHIFSFFSLFFNMAASRSIPIATCFSMPYMLNARFTFYI